MTRERGKLEDWLDQRGFGFIRRPDGSKLYVHMKSIGKSTERPKIGDNLEYTVSPGKMAAPWQRMSYSSPPLRRRLLLPCSTNIHTPRIPFWASPRAYSGLR